MQPADTNYARPISLAAITARACSIKSGLLDKGTPLATRQVFEAQASTKNALPSSVRHSVASTRTSSVKIGDWLRKGVENHRT